MLLTEFRQKYPQYNDMSDKELVNRLYERHYSDIPKDDFYKKIGYSVPPEPSALSQLGKGIKQIPENLGSFTRGAVTEAVNLPAQAANLVLPKGMQFHTFPVEQNPMAQAGQSLSDLGGFFAGGAPAEIARASAAAIPLIGKAAQYLGKTGVLPDAVSMGLGGAAYGAVTNPNNPTQGAIQGGLTGASAPLIPAAFGGIKQSISNITNPTTKLTAFYSPEEIARNMQAAKGSETPLGNIIGDPKLIRKFDIILPKNPRSGAEQKMANTALNITNQGTNLLENYLGNTHPLEVNQKLGEALKNAYNNQQSLKRSLYSNVEDIADASGLKLELPQFSQLAKKYTGLINDTNFLKYEPESKQIMSRLSNYKNPVENLETGLLDAKGNPITNPKYPTLQEANILAGKLGSMAKSHGSSPAMEDQHLASVYGNMAKALKSDIRNTIDQSGNEQLKEAFETAEKNYKDNYAPFLDKQIYQFISGKKSADELVSNFIKTGSSTDQGEKLQKLMSKLSPEDQNLVKYAYFSRALTGDEGNRHVNPLSFKSLWGDRSLGQTQKKALIPNDEERKQVDNYARLAKMNSEGLTRTILPKTGIRAVGAEKDIPEVIGGLVGLVHGGAPTGILGAIAGRIFKDISNKSAVKKLTDEAIRNKLISKYKLNVTPIGSEQPQTNNISMHLNALAQALMANQNP